MHSEVERFTDPYTLPVESDLQVSPSEAEEVFAYITGIEAFRDGSYLDIPEDKQHLLADLLEEAIVAFFDHLDLPTFHHFAPGTYVRELRIPAGTLLTGEVHRYQHLCVVSVGKIAIWTIGKGVSIVEGPCVLHSEPGARRVGFAFEDTVWTTIHPVSTTDLDVIEQDIFVKAPHPKQRMLDRLGN